MGLELVAILHTLFIKSALPWSVGQGKMSHKQQMLIKGLGKWQNPGSRTWC